MNEFYRCEIIRIKKDDNLSHRCRLFYFWGENLCINKKEKRKHLPTL